MRLSAISMFLALSGYVPLAAAQQCRLCAPSTPAATAAPARPISISVETMLDLGRAAQDGRGGGSISIDEQSGIRSVKGLVALGGIAVRGTVRITGEPFRALRITLPATATMINSEGGTALIAGIRSTVGPNPALDANGTLSFDFGGRLQVKAGDAGDYRGRIAVTADYQ